MGGAFVLTSSLSIVGVATIFVVLEVVFSGEFRGRSESSGRRDSLWNGGDFLSSTDAFGGIRVGLAVTGVLARTMGVFVLEEEGLVEV